MDKPSGEIGKAHQQDNSVLKLPPLLAATTANVVMIPSRPPKTKLFTYFPPAPACASSASYLISPSFVLLLFPGVEFLACVVTVEAFALDSCAARDDATSFSLNASFAADNRRVKFILLSRVCVFMCVFMCVCIVQKKCVFNTRKL